MIGDELATEGPKRATAKEFLALQKIDPTSVSSDQLKDFGATAARIGFGRKIPAAKRQEGPYLVHTWPLEVWHEAAQAMLAGTKPPARPASQRQVAYIVALYATSPGALASSDAVMTWAMATFGGVDMDEDVAAQWIHRLERA